MESQDEKKFKKPGKTNPEIEVQKNTDLIDHVETCCKNALALAIGGLQRRTDRRKFVRSLRVEVGPGNLGLEELAEALQLDPPGRGKLGLEKIPGLARWLSSVELEARETEIYEWCATAGAVSARTERDPFPILGDGHGRRGYKQENAAFSFGIKFLSFVLVQMCVFFHDG